MGFESPLHRPYPSDTALFSSPITMSTQIPILDPLAKGAAAPRPYQSPAIEPLGLVSRLTMGSGGSSLDGQGTFNQRGRGNNTGDPTPGTP